MKKQKAVNIPKSTQERVVKLLHAINAATAFLQKSAHSEEDVFQTFREQISTLDLRGGISLLDDSGEYLVFRAIAFPQKTRKVLKRLEKITGFKAEGFKVKVSKVEAYSKVIETEETNYVAQSASIITQLVTGVAGKIIDNVLSALGGEPAIYAPLKSEGKVIGILNIVGDELTPEDIPALEAFANHLSIALENGRLFSKIQEREQTYRTLIETSPDAIIVTDLEGTVTDASQQAFRLYGIGKAEDFIGKNAFEFIAPEDQKIAAENLEKTLLRGAIRDVEYTFLRVDGTRYIGELNAALIRDLSGNPTSLIATVRDITDRKQAEQALRSSEEKYRDIFENVSDYLYIHDLEGNFIETNLAFKKEIGYSEEDIINLNIRDLIPKKYGQGIEEYFALIQDEGKADGVMTFIAKDGHMRIVEYRNSTIYDQTGPTRIRGSARDITDRLRAENALRASEELYKALVDTSPDAVILTDMEGIITYASQRAVEFFGYNDINNLLGRSNLDFIASEEHHKATSFIEDTSAKGLAKNIELTLLKKNGTSFTGELNAALIRDAHRKPKSIIATIRDISDRKKAEGDLRRKTSLQETLLDIARYLNESLDVNEVLRRIATRAKDILNAYGSTIYLLTDDEKTLTPVVAIEPPYEEEILSTPLEVDRSFTGKAIKARRTMVFNQIPANHDGYQIPGTPIEENERVIVAPFIIDDFVLGAMCLNRIGGQFFDDEDTALAEAFANFASIAIKNAQTYDALQREVEMRKSVEQQLLHDAFHDGLTGLPNRALFMDRLGRAIVRAKRRTDYHFAVLFLDLDRFKVINDSLGHTIGDQLLIKISERLQICLRAVDTVARVGGDEFVILLEDIEDINEAIQVSNRILDDFMRHFTLNGHEVFCSTSIGIVISAASYENPDDVLQDADIAMYRAKTKGKARFEIFDKAMRERAVARLVQETDLRWSLDNQGFIIHYQPLVEIETCNIVGFEALIRWQHPREGLLEPSEFLPLAEETGLIILIGNWVLREACRQVCEWQAKFPMDPPLTISVNVSSRQFTHPDLIENIDNVLQETGLEPNCFHLEITEAAVMDIDSAIPILHQLRELGIRIEMDDFGTGYSSLSNLHLFPIETLKIDRSFISRMGSKEGKTGIIRTIMALARDLGIDIIAEGVETKDQLEVLRELNCGIVQGYYFSRPVNTEIAAELIAKNWRKRK